MMRALGGVKLLILGDWRLEPFGPEQRDDMLEIVEDRYGELAAGAVVAVRTRRLLPFAEEPSELQPPLGALSKLN
jgi:hypothetical protein